MKRHHFLWVLGLIFGSSLFVAACTDDSLMEPEQQPAPTSELASSPANPLSFAFGTGACMGNDAVSSGGLVSGFGSDPLAFNCTAGDIVIANAQTVSGQPIECVPGDPINDVDIVADIVQNSQSDRVDIGIWIENGDNMGGGAEDGDCDFFYFDGDDVTASAATDEDSDQCGDLVAKAVVEDFDLGGLDLICPTSPVVVEGQTYIEIQSCISWTQPGGDRVCPVNGGSNGAIDFRHGTLPANKSKCECDGFLVPVSLKAQLTLKKNVTNDAGGTAKASAWTLNAGSLINEAGACTDSGDPCPMAVTSTKLADPGDYALSETNGPSNYSVSSDWSCDGGSLNTSTNTITLAAGDNVTCQITNNDDDPKLTLKKSVINDAGGTAKANEWTLNAGSLINEAGSCTDDGSVCSMALTTKTTAVAGVGYALSETNGPSGYAVSTDWQCDGGTLSSNTITLGLGDDVTCTIENDDAAAMLTLKKTVTNDDGGTAKANEWTLNAGSVINEAGSCTDDGSVCSMALTTKTEVDANTGYALSETNGPSNYSVATDWSCDGGSLNTSTNTITLSLDDDVTCTIVNTDDPPSLTLKKTVTNDDGGTAKANEWTLNAGSLINEAGSCTDDGSVCSMALTTKTEADANTGYALSETNGPSNYSVATDWSCDGGSLSSNTITLGLGDDVTCTIVNTDDPPSLTLKKTVTNDDGGTAKANEWTLNAGSLINEAGSCTDDGSVCSMALTTKTEADANTGYALSETNGPSNYSVATDWSCDGGSLSSNTITLGLGDDVTCTIVNTDDTPQLKLVKNVSGGTDGPDAWTLSASASSPNNGRNFSNAGGSGTFQDVFANAGYTLAESGPTGYEAGSWSCDGGSLSSNVITLGVGDMVTCQITNTFIPPACETGDRLTSVSLELIANSPNPITIQVTDDNGKDPAPLASSPGSITTGAMFTVVPDGGATFFDSQNLRFILNGKLSKNLKVHLSCSDDPAVGDTHSGNAGSASATLQKTGFVATQFN